MVKAEVDFSAVAGELPMRATEWLAALSPEDRINLGRSFAFFCRYYLNMRVPEHQLRWVQYTERQRHIQLAPRDHGKSTIFSFAYVLWAICYSLDLEVPEVHPNVRILFVSKTQGQAIKYTEAIRRQLMENERLRNDFGELRADRGYWSSNMLSCMRDYSLSAVDPRDPTFEAIGAGCAITGGHFDIIIVDDILDDENVRTESRRRSMEDWFFGTLSLLVEPHTRMFVIGTRKHWDDLYGKLLVNPLWQADVQRAVIRWPDDWEKRIDIEWVERGRGREPVASFDGDWSEWEVLWPEKWSAQALLQEWYRIGPIMFEREMQNNADVMRGRLLPAEWLQTYKSEECPPLEALYIYAGVDLAIGESDEAKFFVICTIGVERRDNFTIWVLDYIRQRISFPEQVALLGNYYRSLGTNRPLRIGIEINGYQLALQQQAFREYPELPLEGIRTVRDKEARMIALGPAFKHRIKIREDMAELIREYLEFPGETTDILDALDFAVSVSATATQPSIGFARSGLSSQDLLGRYTDESFAAQMKSAAPGTYKPGYTVLGPGDPGYRPPGTTQKHI